MQLPFLSFTYPVGQSLDLISSGAGSILFSFTLLKQEYEPIVLTHPDSQVLEIASSSHSSMSRIEENFLETVFRIEWKVATLTSFPILP